MGAVYQARQLSLKRVVALKVLRRHGELTFQERSRFRRETEAIARLRHPNLVQIYEVGEHAGQLYYTMELVEGCTLDEHLKQTPQAPHHGAELVQALARGIHAAHSAGIVHRDLKPSNVLIAPASLEQPLLVKIVDFGLAKDMTRQEDLTETGIAIGTFRYMAPEQIQGAREQIGPATDVHALGILLYEMLTGRPPFQSESQHDCMVEIVDVDPIPPTRLRRSVPRDLETICLKCLAKQPRQRYGSAQELAEDLRRFQEGLPIKARPTGVRERVAKWARRKPAVAALLVLVVAVTLTGTVLVAWKWREAALAWSQERERAIEAERHRIHAQEVAVRAALGRALGLCEVGDVPRGILWLARSLELVQEVPEEQGADLEAAIRWNLSAWAQELGGLERIFDQAPQTVWTAALSPDGQRLLTAGNGNRVFLWVRRDSSIGNPFSERRTLGHLCPGSSGLPVTDEAKGNKACRKSGGRTASGMYASQDPRGMVKARLLEVQSRLGP